MAGALVAISALPVSTTILSTDILPFVKSGTTDRITAGNLRTQLFAFAATDPLNCGILTAVGNSSITGTLSGITALTATTSATFGNTAAAAGIIRVPNNTNISARNAANTADIVLVILDTIDKLKLGNSSVTISVAAGTTGNTVIGGNLTVSGGLVSPNVSSGTLSFTPVASQIVPGVTSFSVRNNANSADNLLILDAGGATFRSTLAIAGALTGVTSLTMSGALSGATSLATSGTLTFSAASSKVVPGATQLSFRNNADSADNLLISDNGTITTRLNITLGTTLNFSSAASKLIPGATSFSIRDSADSADQFLMNASGFTLARKLNTVASTTGGAGFNLPSGTAPTSPADGDMWFDGAAYKGRISGVTKTFTVT